MGGRHVTSGYRLLNLCPVQAFNLSYDSDWVSGQVTISNALDVYLNRFAKLNFHEQEMEAVVSVVA